MISRHARGFILGLFAVIAVASFAYWAFPPHQEPYEDGQDYFRIAEGNPSSAYSYYAGRVFHPWLARAAAEISGSSLQDGFRLVSVLSLLMFGFVVTIPNRQSFLAIGFAVLTIAAPVVISAYQAYYFQTLCYSAILAGGLLVLKERRWLFLPFLVLLYLTRESTVLITIALVTLATLRKDSRFAVAVAIVSVCCLITVRILVSQGIPDKHGLNPFLFYGLKIAYSLAYNFFGLVFWTNTNATTIVCIPSVRWDVSSIAMLGKIKEIGFCGFYPELPLHSALLLVTAFGVCPAIIWLCRSSLFRLLRTGTYDLALATSFGVLALLSAYFTGPGMGGYRYMMYTWPLFIYMSLWILSLFGVVASSRDVVLLLVCQFIALWLPFSVFLDPTELDENRIPFLLATGMLMLATGIQVFVFYRFRYLRDVSKYPRARPGVEREPLNAVGRAADAGP
jgi:hypothetical protein